MSLANKYRPQTFDEMIGQEHIIDILKAQMKARESIHHNYLLFGPRGTGKTTSARLIAKGLNCLNLQDGNPCNQCSNCELINKGTSLDYTEIDAASHTGVDNIREEIIDKALYPPTTLKKKIYVIDEVHMLSKGAFNALLKTIEEPKNNVCFIFATTEIHKVPDTIISRCQVFNYRKVQNSAMVKHLLHICQKEQFEASTSALEIIANISEGCVRDAVKYIDQVSILGAINEENITRFLGVAGESTIKNLLESIKNGKRKEVFDQLDNISESGIDLGQFAKQVIGYIDQHLLEDTDFLLQCSEIFGSIMSTLRRYPYPIIAYKIAINKYFGAKEETNIIDKKTDIQTPISTTEKQQTFISTEDKQQIIDSQQSATVQGSSTIFSTQNKEQSKIIPDSEQKESEGQQDSSPLQNEKKSENININNTTDFKKLRNTIVDQIGKPTVQSNLRDQAIIEKIEENQIFLTVITKIAEMLLSNEENKKNIEMLFSKELGKNMQIVSTFENKESYFARKMGI